MEDIAMPKTIQAKQTNDPSPVVDGNNIQAALNLVVGWFYFVWMYE